MLGLQDVTETDDEENAIQIAAAPSGVDTSVFAMNAAYRNALDVIAAHECTALQAVDYESFFTALNTPPASTDALRGAFRRHRETIISK